MRPMPLLGGLHLSPCGRGRIASVDAIRVRGYAFTIDLNPSPQPYRASFARLDPTRGEGAHRHCRDMVLHHSSPASRSPIAPLSGFWPLNPCAPDASAAHLAPKRGIEKPPKNDIREMRMAATRIHCDIHPAIGGTRTTLLPYLDDHWKEQGG